MKRMTKEQFIGQFPYKCNVDKIKHLLVREHHPIQDWYEGVEVYRALNQLMVKIGDDFYCHG